MTKQTAVLNLCLARHIARLEGRSEAIAITKAARRIRDETKDKALYELVKMYAGDIAPATVDGKRLTGDKLKVMSVAKLESGLREFGVL
jgi:hypothetical protein